MHAGLAIDQLRLLIVSLFRESKRFQEKNKRKPGKATSEERSTSTSTTSTHEDDPLEYYNSNQRLPVYTKDRQVLKPEEVVDILMEKIEFLESRGQVCTCQPLLIQHHRTFIVDMKALGDDNDVKCDDMGSWRNNSCNKYNFESNVKDYTAINNGLPNIVTLKRDYFSLKHDVYDDVRKRIDTLFREYTLYTI